VGLSSLLNKQNTKLGSIFFFRTLLTGKDKRWKETQQ
jgi:hypothetical protein